MIFAFWMIVAVLGATIHRWRDQQPRSTARTLELYLVWWVVVVLGIGNMVGGLFHIVDGPDTAREIGFTRGDGGFQFENAIADEAFGVLCVLTIWFRGAWLVAAIVGTAISWWGDAYGHIYQAHVNDNHDPDNTGVVLYSDIISPLIALALYAVYRRAGGGKALREKPSGP
jgi:hypothetical protein